MEFATSSRAAVVRPTWPDQWVCAGARAGSSTGRFAPSPRTRRWLRIQLELLHDRRMDAL